MLKIFIGDKKKLNNIGAQVADKYTLRALVPRKYITFTAITFIFILLIFICFCLRAFLFCINLINLMYCDLFV